MNYISTNHRGGLGNVLFKLAATIGVALDNKVEYLFSNEFIRPIDRITTKGFDDYRIYYDNILRNVTFVDKLPNSYISYEETNFHYTPINYEPGTNLVLCGGFQSEKYFEKHSDLIIDLFKPTDDITTLIKTSYPDIHDFISIHVRRGDYLQFPDHHPQQTKEYYQTAVDYFGIDKTYLIFSDDLDGCKDIFDFLPNKYFITSGIDWVDMYIMSMCGNNIICNSSFSWWAAYINTNKNKQVITTKNWFGPVYKDWDISTLFPKSWIIL